MVFLKLRDLRVPVAGVPAPRIVGPRESTVFPFLASCNVEICLSIASACAAAIDLLAIHLHHVFGLSRRRRVAV